MAVYLHVYLTPAVDGSKATSVVGIAASYRLEFESQWAQEFSYLHVVSTGCRAHPASYPMDNGRFFAGGKAARV
jgi:hypothetical protein